MIKSVIFIWIVDSIKELLLGVAIVLWLLFLCGDVVLDLTSGSHTC